LLPLCGELFDDALLLLLEENDILRRRLEGLEVPDAGRRWNPWQRVHKSVLGGITGFGADAAVVFCSLSSLFCACCCAEFLLLFDEVVVLPFS